MSGGASSLLALPAAGVTLAEKQAINSALLKSGAAIDEMNCVRKHLSAIKGGRLAAACAPARVVTLLVSDVPGDSPSVIGSGPTVPDPTTCADALAVLARYGIEVAPAIRAGLEKRRLETPKPGDPVFAGQRGPPRRDAAAVARRRGRARPQPPASRRTSSATRSKASRARSPRSTPRWRARSRVAASRSRGPASFSQAARRR